LHYPCGFSCVKSSAKGRSCFMLIHVEQTSLKNKKHVVQKDSFLRVTLSIDQIYNFTIGC